MKKILLFLIPLIILIVLWSFFTSSKENTETFQKDWEKEITSRKRYLQHNENSPFKLFNIAYKEPVYYPYDPSYRVEATVNKIETKEIVTIETSDGQKQRYQKYAFLNFTLKNTPLKLVVLSPMGFGSSNLLYCAFADETSANQTYGGGRYLDVKIGKSNKVILDFNYAYNPYCAYASAYSCPLPPRENILPIEIFVGEKNYKIKN